MVGFFQEVFAGLAATAVLASPTDSPIAGAELLACLVLTTRGLGSCQLVVLFWLAVYMAQPFRPPPSHTRGINTCAPAPNREKNGPRTVSPFVVAANLLLQHTMTQDPLPSAHRYLRF